MHRADHGGGRAADDQGAERGVTVGAHDEEGVGLVRDRFGDDLLRLARAQGGR
jgi:hypothetical protein